MIKALDKRIVNLSKTYDIIMTVFLSIFLVFVPTFLARIVPLGSNSQLIIGTIVNALLIIAALFLKGKVKTALVCTMPSMATILGGLLFSEATIYSKAMIPFIWIGNFIFIYLYKKLYLQKKVNYIITAGAAVIGKVTAIYLGFRLMALILSPPKKVFDILSVSMSETQLITATLGSILVLIILGIIKNIKREQK